MVEVARELIGEPSVKYTYGQPELGQSKRGFDCSGFARFVLMSAGFVIPDYIGMDGAVRPIRHSNEFWDHYGVATQIPAPGDLLFFSRHGEYPTHVGIVSDPETYIHAPGIDGTQVAISGIRKSRISRKNDGANRQLHHTNPIGYKSPTVPLAAPTYRYHQQTI